MVKQQKIVLMAAGLAGAFLAAILLVGTVAEVAAQGGTRPGFARGGGPGGLGLFGPGGAGLDGANLTDTQKDQVKGIVDSHREEMRALLDRQALARRALTLSAESGRVDDAAANEVGAASAALALAEAHMRAEVFQVLTPEQFARNVKIRENSGEMVDFAIRLPGDEKAKAN